MLAFRNGFIALVLSSVWAVPAAAQHASQERTGAAGSGTTLHGDTGLWFVPSASVLPSGAFSSGIHAASDIRDQGAVRTAFNAASLAAGIGGRAEVFGSWQMTTSANGRRGRGDLVAGTKINLLSEDRGGPLALAVRGVVKLPTGNEAPGLSTGKADLLTDVIATRRFGRAAITGSTGVVWRGDPEGETLPNGLRTGVGLAVDAHRALRLFTEVQGATFGGASPVRPLIAAFDTAPTAAAGLSLALAPNLTATAGVNRILSRRAGASTLR